MLKSHMAAEKVFAKQSTMTESELPNPVPRLLRLVTQLYPYKTTFLRACSVFQVLLALFSRFGFCGMLSVTYSGDGWLSLGENYSHAVECCAWRCNAEGDLGSVTRCAFEILVGVEVCWSWES
jgi:hypothetical protein